MEHLHEELGGDQGVDDAVEARARRRGGQLGLGSEMSWVGASELEFALQIGEGNVDVAHGHFPIDVSEQLHKDREADPGTRRLCGIGVSELVRNYACGQLEYGETIESPGGDARA